MNYDLIHLTSLPLGFGEVGLFHALLANQGWIFCFGGTVLVVVFIVIFWVCNQRRHPQQKPVRAESVSIPTAASADDGVDTSEFLAAVGHEIRNPMNGIVGIVESIKIDGLDPDSRHKVMLLRQCASHVASLVEDVLDFSEVRTDAFKLESKPFDVGGLMESIAALSAMESEKRGIPIEIAISPAVPRQLTGDPRRIRQILLNYVYNALKYSRDGTVNITVWRNQISPGLAEIFFAVSDDGPGIPADEQGKIFRRVERDPDMPSAKAMGRGLGLFICKTLAEKMSGKVWFKTQENKGACFYFSATFPFPNDENHPATSLPAPLPGNLRNALLIDDAEYNRIALAGMLESLGLNVRATADSEEFLSLARSQAFDVIFIDYAVFGVEGPALAKKIRTMSGASAHARIFATTGFHTAEKRVACLTAGMDAFLAKPITLDRLRRALGAGAASEKSPNLRPIPRDPLGNLRLLAAKKGAQFKDELSLYFVEFDAELAKLADALQKEDYNRASYFGHLLYGRCSFINERDLELTLRKIEAIAAMERWDEARDLGRHVQLQLGKLRLKLTSDIPVAPPG